MIANYGTLNFVQFFLDHSVDLSWTVQ